MLRIAAAPEVLAAHSYRWELGARLLDDFLLKGTKKKDTGTTKGLKIN